MLRKNWDIQFVELINSDEQEFDNQNKSEDGLLECYENRSETSSQNDAK